MYVMSILHMLLDIGYSGCDKYIIYYQMKIVCQVIWMRQGDAEGNEDYAESPSSH